MADKSVIIIGAGLAAGCYAQMSSIRSGIFEHHSVPGGVAAAWKRGDYLIDGGIHFLMGYKPGPATTQRSSGSRPRYSTGWSRTIRGCRARSK
jgi:phytoene dehydrogenase-like protein